MRAYKIILSIIVIAIVIGAGSLFYIRYLIFTPANAAGAPEEFIVNEGESATKIAENLKTRGLIKSAFVFKFYGTWKRQLNKLQAGEFEISSEMSIADILNILSGNSTQEEKFTIIEGERLIEIARNLESKDIVSYSDFMKEASDESDLKGQYNFLKTLPKGASLEGFIFPDSYGFNKEMTVQDIVKKALDNFSDKTKNLKISSKSKYNLYEVVIMASIVEREAAKDEDRAKIASVYFNRLDNGMMLQADPTIQYAKGNWEPISVADYLSVDSSYNTYLHKGFPPGPICNPGIASIEAAVHPAKTNYLYFFHLKDGTTIFSKTRAEHDAAKAKYRLAGMR